MFMLLLYFSTSMHILMNWAIVLRLRVHVTCYSVTRVHVTCYSDSVRLAKWCSKNYHRRQLHSARILLREASARGIGCTALRRGKQHRSAWPSSYLTQRLATTPLLAARTGSKRRLQQATTVSLLGRTPWSGASTKERRKIGPSAGATDVAGQAYERKRAQTWAQRTLPEDPTQPIDEVRQHRREFLIHELPTFGGYCSTPTHTHWLLRCIQLIHKVPSSDNRIAKDDHKSESQGRQPWKAQDWNSSQEKQGWRVWCTAASTEVAWQSQHGPPSPETAIVPACYTPHSSSASLAGLHLLRPAGCGTTADTRAGVTGRLRCIQPTGGSAATPTHTHWRLRCIQLIHKVPSSDNRART